MRFSISSCASQWRSNISLPKRTVHFLVLSSKPWLCVHCIYQVNTSLMSLWTLQARSSKSPTKNIILFLITLSCSSLVLDSSHFPHLHLILEFFSILLLCVTIFNIFEDLRLFQANITSYILQEGVQNWEQFWSIEQ